MGYTKLMTLGEVLAAFFEMQLGYQAVDEHGKTDEGKRWWLERREFEDGRTLYLYPCGSGVSLGIGTTPTDCGYRWVYDYFQQPMEGVRAAVSWDGQGEPEGWNRAHQIGFLIRRRPEGCGPEHEYVDPHDLTASGYPKDEHARAAIVAAELERWGGWIPANARRTT